MDLAGSEAKWPRFHHFPIGSLGKWVQSVTCLQFPGQWAMTMRKNLLMAPNERKTVEVKTNHKMGGWPLCLWSGCGSPVFPQNSSSQKRSLMGIFLPLSFFISKMKVIISPFDVFSYIRSRWIWFFKCVLYTIISMIVMKMKSILHNRCCQLLCVVSSKRIFILFPSCIFSFWTNLNKNVFLKNTTSVVLAPLLRRSALHTGTWPALWFGNVGNCFTMKHSSYPTVIITEDAHLRCLLFNLLYHSLCKYNLRTVNPACWTECNLGYKSFHFKDWFGK